MRLFLTMCKKYKQKFQINPALELYNLVLCIDGMLERSHLPCFVCAVVRENAAVR